MITPIVAAEDELSRVPNLELAQLVYRYDLNLTTLTSVDELKLRILALIDTDSMSVYYEFLGSKYGWEIDVELLSKMKEINKNELEELEKKQKDIINNAGDLEAIEIESKIGKYYARIGDFTKAVKSFDIIVSKPKAGAGRKIDACFDKAKVYLFTADVVNLKQVLTEVSKLIDSDGDWDRRNKLKVFEAIYCIIVRDLKKASTLLQDGIATFSNIDICSYDEFLFYTIITNILAIPRIDLKKKIIDNAHVISMLISNKKLDALLNSLYSCDYRLLMKTLLDIETDLLQNRYFGPHSVYILKEFRILGFKQFLEAYKSVLLPTMASNFGISVSMLDLELSKFIASGRLNAKIDKVANVVETIKSDSRNEQYQVVVKKGDALLNSVQKLVRVIDQ